MAAIRSNSNGSEGPPAKKRLKLSVRKPSSPDGDTIAVSSRPKRASAGRSHYSEDVIESDDDIDEMKVKQSPAASSGLSSPLSESESVKDEAPGKYAKTEGTEGYGDAFLNYYVTGGDDPQEDFATAPAPKRKPELAKRKSTTREKQPRKPRAKKVPATQPSISSVTSTPQSVGQPSNMLPPRPTSRHNANIGHSNAPLPVHVPHQIHSSAQPPAVSAPAAIPSSIPTQMQPPQRPIPEPPALEEITVKYHASVEEKILKLEVLSAALTKFGGLSPANKVPPSIDENTKEKKADKAVKNKTEPKKPAKKDAHLDNFLELFDSDEDSSDAQHGSNSETDDQVEKPRYLEHTGEPDGPLTYGIQFIMNALKSWAQARLQSQHLAAIQQGQMPPPPSTNGLTSTSRSTVPRRPSLSDTHEGKAIAAFRDVVESGCLQVNVVMPADLAAAVRHLYMQIDHLINQGSKAPLEPYQAMSYSAQIKAHQMRVDRWRDQEARAQQAMGQHHQTPPGFYQMPPGIGPAHIPNGHFHPPPHPNQIHNASDRRRSTPQVPTQHHDRQPPRVSLPAGINGLPPSPMNGSLAGAPPNPQGGYPRPEFPQGDMTLEERARLMQTGNYRLPRSGQTMTFSFAPENPAALQAFGPGAFPAMNQPHGSNIPNRGPMPPLKTPPVVPTQMRPASKGEQDRPKSEHDSRSPAGKDPHAHPARTSSGLKPSGFTAVNAPAMSAQDSRPTSASQSKSPGLSRSDAVVLDE